MAGDVAALTCIQLQILILPKAFVFPFCLGEGLPGPPGPPGRSGSSMSASGRFFPLIPSPVPCECPDLWFHRVHPWLGPGGARCNLCHVLLDVVKKPFCFNYRCILHRPTRSTRPTRPEGRPRWVYAAALPRY